MFYVYKLIDPRDGLPFYVGKGKGRRAWQHADDVRKGRASGNKAKDTLIAELLAGGLEPIVVIVQEFEEQSDAFVMEVELIASILTLTNIRRGGEGWGFSAEETRRRKDAMRQRQADNRHKNTRKWLKGWLAMVDKWPGVTFPGMPDGDRRAQEVVDFVRASLSRG